MKIERTKAWWLAKAAKEGDCPVGAVGGAVAPAKTADAPGAETAPDRD